MIIWLRFLVLIVVLLIALAVVILGFCLTLKEYRLMRSRLLEEALAEGATHLEADLLKGSLSLTGVTQGIVLCSPGVVVLLTVALVRVEYTETHSEKGKVNQVAEEPF